MLIIALIIATLFVVCFFESKRMSAILTFIAPAALFQALAPIIDPDFFHLLGGGFDLLVIVMLAFIFRSGWVVLILAVISGLSICANYYGWLLYQSFKSPANYDSVGTGVYAFVLLMSLMEWWAIAGESGYHSLVRRFRNFGHQAHMEDL